MLQENGDLSSFHDKNLFSFPSL